MKRLSHLLDPRLLLLALHLFDDGLVRVKALREHVFIQFVNCVYWTTSYIILINFVEQVYVYQVVLVVYQGHQGVRFRKKLLLVHIIRLLYLLL